MIESAKAIRECGEDAAFEVRAEIVAAPRLADQRRSFVLAPGSLAQARQSHLARGRNRRLLGKEGFELAHAGVRTDQRFLRPPAQHSLGRPVLVALDKCSDPLEPERGRPRADRDPFGKGPRGRIG